MNDGQDTVLILGAGINGCALARELALNGVSVWLVDSADIASGATGGSSHLIHGGLRYLEYGDFALVRESLAERGRLLRLAPQFVRPLQLWIPSVDRLGGFWSAIGRFWGWRWWPARPPKHGRGAWLVRAALAWYDHFARDPLMPRHRSMSVATSGAPRVNRDKYHWLSSYYDAQVVYPERLVMGLVCDARRQAFIHSAEFRVFPHHAATLAGAWVEIAPLLPTDPDQSTKKLRPAMIVNATGAWVDETLRRLQVRAPRLMGGTKGSHIFTFNARLREILGDDGLYAEAADGRPIFITPLDQAILIGTTDVRFEGPPETAVATPEEIAYLLAAVNDVVPESHLTVDDVDFHYSAVRPLPAANAATPAAISRRHAIVRHDTAVPMISLVGGKLTTMRSLAESAAAEVLRQLGRPLLGNSRQQSIPGALDCPSDPKLLPSVWQLVAERTGFTAASVAATWRLYGNWTDAVLLHETHGLFAMRRDRELLDGTPLPCQVVRYAIQSEHAQTLSDLVERRLMLLYHQRLTKACLRRLAELLVEARRLPAGEVDLAVGAEIARLKERYGKRVE